MIPRRERGEAGNEDGATSRKTAEQSGKFNGVRVSGSVKADSYVGNGFDGAIHGRGGEAA
jgi:hypothetical protein